MLSKQGELLQNWLCPVTMQRLQDICGIKNFCRTRRWAKVGDGAINKDFENLKIAVSTRTISRFADAAQFQRYIQVITSINFGIPVYS